MFGYLRLFSLVSFLAVLIIAGLVSLYFRSLASTDLKTMAERGNLAVAESYGATVWQAHRQAFLHVPLSQPQDSGAIPARFSAESATFFRAVSQPWVIVYNAAGVPVHSTRPSATPQVEMNQDIAGLRTSAAKAHSDIIKEVPEDLRARIDQEQPGEHVFVRSLIPIGSKAAPELYLEIYTGITSQWQKLVLLQWVASGGIVTVFCILIWILVLTSKKAEDIISRQHEANMELAAAAANAQAENREKSLFLANISHELRTPLNAIIGFSEIIKNEMLGAVPNSSYQSYIHDIHTSGVHLLSLINDILDFSKAEAGKLEMEISEVNANKMVSNCMRLISPRAESAQVLLAESLPREPIVLVTDGKKFKQIMLNLLSNAVKFTPAGGEVKVSAWQNVAEDTFTFEVTDTGIGIAPKDISRAMSAFGQVDNTLSRKYDGTGLGLPLTKKFVELMGGKFIITSELGQGTVIRFTLPRQFTTTGEVPVRMIA